MSFNFSLDDEDNEDDDIELNLEGFDDTGLLALASREKEYESSAVDPRRSSSNIRAVLPSKNNGYNEEDFQRRDCDNDGVAEDDGDWSDDIDWQDDDDENYGERDHPEPSFSEQSPVEVCIRRKLPSHGVTINFGSLADEDGGDDNDDRKKTKKRKRAPTPKVLRSIPVETQLLIRGIRRVQLLCYLAVGSRCSYICGRNVMNSIDSQERGSDESEHVRDLLSHIAFSLVPLKFHDGEVGIEKSNETKEITDAKTSGQIARNSNLWKNQPSTPHSTTTENPMDSPRKKHYIIPTKAILRQFSQWFFQLVNQASNRRREIIARNIAMGATIMPNNNILNSYSKTSYPRRQHDQLHTNDQKNADRSKLQSENSPPSLHPTNARQRRTCIPTTKKLLQRLMHLSPHFDEDPQLFFEREAVIDSIDFSDISSNLEDSDASSAVEKIPALEKVLLFLSLVRRVSTFCVPFFIACHFYR